MSRQFGDAMMRMESDRQRHYSSSSSSSSGSISGCNSGISTSSMGLSGGGHTTVSSQTHSLSDQRKYEIAGTAVCAALTQSGLGFQSRLGDCYNTVMGFPK